MLSGKFEFLSLILGVLEFFVDIASAAKRARPALRLDEGQEGGVVRDVVGKSAGAVFECGGDNVTPLCVLISPRDGKTGYRSRHFFR